MTASVLRIRRIGFTAADLGRTMRFYAALGFESLGIEPVAAAEMAMLDLPGARAERLSMRLGGQEVEFLRVEPSGRPYPADSTSTDLWFQHIAIAVSDMAEAHRRAMEAGAAAITRDAPQTLPPNTGGVTAFKFRDPDGHPLELLFFPPGTGEKVWQDRVATSPFLGIDHTAIAVSDPARARTFYEALGFVTATGSENAGPGQERLDDVDEDRVAVVPLLPPRAPPHLELLGYETGTRRPMPPGTRADDAWASRIVLDATFTAVGGEKAAAGPNTGRAILTHDPDGHAIVLAEWTASA